MSTFATRRLIDAASALPPAERAQLNLWVNRGLDDPALARMTGMTLEAIAVRRERIVGHLSEELGLPPDQILAALADIAASSFGEDLPTPINGQATAVSPAEDPPAAESVAKTPAESAAEPEPAPLNGHRGAAQVASAPVAGLFGADGDGPPAPQRRRPGRRAAIGGLLGLVALILTAVLAFGSGSSSFPGKSTRTRVRIPTTTTAGTPNAQTSASPSPTLSRPPQQPLSALPGATDHATGSVMAIGNRQDLSLKLTVRGLPPAVHGYYETWLYNSIIDSVPLGRLRGGVTDVSLRLPAGAPRYRWIDVSLQPVGMVFHSGESVLRAANPAAAAHR